MAGNKDRLRKSSVFGDRKTTLSELMDDMTGTSTPVELEISENRIGSFERTPVGLIAPNRLTQEQWLEAGDILLRIDSALQWYLGDWVAYADVVRYGDLPELAEKYGKQVQTLYNYASVCRAVEISRRREDLTFGHHEVVASFSSSDQTRWLALAAEGDINPETGEHRRWSVKRLRQEVQQPPALSDGNSHNFPSGVDLDGKVKEIRAMKRRLLRVGQGDRKAKREAMDWVADQRQWLDDLQDWIEKQ